MTERLLTVRDVALILGISEKEVLDLAEDGKLPAYKIGGVYLRFKPEQIEEFRKKAGTTSSLHKGKASRQDSPKDSISDFFYFNDFYIFSILIILLIMLVILRG